MGFLTFGEALALLKTGGCVWRIGWNGKGMWLTYVGADRWSASSELTAGAEAYAPFIAMKTADGKFVPWLASQTDILSEDWVEGHVL